MDAEGLRDRLVETKESHLSHCGREDCAFSIVPDALELEYRQMVVRLPRFMWSAVDGYVARFNALAFTKLAETGLIAEMLDVPDRSPRDVALAMLIEYMVTKGGDRSEFTSKDDQQP